MSERVTIEKTKLSNLADAIREKSGKAATMTLAEMTTTVEGLEKDKTPELLTNTLTAYSNSDITSLREHAFYGSSALKTIKLPALTTLGAYCFAYSGATTIETGKIETITDGAFLGSQLQDATDILANATTIMDYAFQNSQIGGTVEIGENVKKVGSYAFQNTQMEKLVFNTKNVCPYFSFGYYRDNSKLTTIKLKKVNYLYGNKSSINNPNVVKAWLGTQVTKQSFSGTGGLFYGASSDLQIYVEASKVPDAWPTDWDLIDASTHATVHYNVTEEEFDKL